MNHNFDGSGTFCKKLFLLMKFSKNFIKSANADMSNVNCVLKITVTYCPRVSIKF